MARRKVSNRIRKKRRRRNRIIMLVLFVVSIFSLLIYSVSIFFKIKEIEISGNMQYKSSEILESLDTKVGDSLVFFNKNAIKENLLENYPYIEQVNINREYPDKLIVEITEVEKAGTIYFEDEHYFISNTGKVLEKTSLDKIGDTAKIIGFDTASIDETIKSTDSFKEDTLWTLFEYLEKYEMLDIVTEINITKTYDIIITCGTKYQIELGDIEDIEHKMKMFQEVLKKLTPSDTVIVNLSDKSYARFRTEEIIPAEYP